MRPDGETKPKVFGTLVTVSSIGKPFPDRMSPLTDMEIFIFAKGGLAEAEQTTAGFDSIRGSSRMVHVDSSKPGLVKGFTRNTFTAMIEGVKESADQTGLIGQVDSNRFGHKDSIPPDGPAGENRKVENRVDFIVSSPML